LKTLDDKKHWFLWILVLWAVFQLVQLDNEWDRMDGDDAQYILHARSLVVHHQYNDPNLIYRPGAITTAESVPPGWPVLLVPVVAIFGTNLLVLKLYVILFALGSGIFLYKILERFTRDTVLSMLIAARFCFSMTTIVFSRVVYSEWPYMLASYVVLFLLLKQDQGRYSVWKWIAVGLLTGTAVLCRSVGMSLVLTILVVFAQEAFVQRKQIKTILAKALVFGASLLVLYEAVYFITKPDKGPGYKSQFLSKNIDFQEQGQATFKDILNRIPENGMYFVKSMGPQLFGRYWHEYTEYKFPHLTNIIQPLLYVIGAFLLIFFLLGFVLELRKKPSVIWYYTLFYLLIMSVIWFNYEVYRYIMPISTFILLYTIDGFVFFLERFRKGIRPVKRIVYPALLVLLAINVFHSVIEVYKYKYSSQNANSIFQPYKSTVVWLKKSVLPDEIIIADEPRWYALETGLKVTTFLKSRDADKVMRYIEQFPRSVIVFDNKRRFQRLCLVPMFQKYENRFRLLQEFGHIKIYQFRNTPDG